MIFYNCFLLFLTFLPAWIWIYNTDCSAADPCMRIRMGAYPFWKVGMLFYSCKVFIFASISDIGSSWPLCCSALDKTSANTSSLKLCILMFYFYFISNINVVGLQHYNLQPLLWIQLFISMQIRIRSQTDADPDPDPGHKKSNFYMKNIMKVGNRSTKIPTEVQKHLWKAGS